MKRDVVWKLFLLWAFIFAAGCAEDTPPDPNPGNGDKELADKVSYKILKEYAFNDLKDIEEAFKEKYFGFSLGLISFVGSEPQYGGNTQLKVFKISVESLSTDGSEKDINLSGVLIVPPLENEQTYRQVVAPPYTYIMETDAPTLRVENNNPDPHLIFWILQAYKSGYAVMIPDYPGFGDSYGECYIPYVEREPMVRTTVEYVNAVRYVLEEEQYEQKEGFIISGYSLGAFASLSLAYELETNAAYQQMPVDLLFIGGTPCDLLYQANLIRSSEQMPQPYLFPLALLGYKKNGYQHLEVGHYLKEPYASQAAEYLNGKNEGFSSFFPNKTSALFTDAFLKDESMEEVNQILSDNSAETWKNRCKFIMTHGENDETVYYEQAKSFASEQKDNGGTVSFVTTSGTHTSAGTWFYLRLYSELGNLD